MKSSVLNILSAVLLFSTTGSAIVAEDRPDPSRSDAVFNFTPSDYLEKQHAQRNIRNLRTRVEQDLIKLGRITRNYGKDVEGAEDNYNEIAAIYRKAVEAYYGRKILESYKLLRTCKERSDLLYAQYIDLYKGRIGELLGRLSTDLTEAEMKMLQGRQESTSRSIDQGKHRMAIARSQMTTAEEMTRFKRPDLAVNHYWNAKILTILSIRALQPEESGKKQVVETYKLDLIDAGFDITRFDPVVVPDTTESETKAN